MTNEAMSDMRSKIRRDGLQMGALIVFKPNVDPGVAAMALDTLREAGVLDENYHLEYPDADYTKRAKRVPYKLELFNPRHGGPVFYLP